MNPSQGLWDSEPARSNPKFHRVVPFWGPRAVEASELAELQNQIAGSEH